MAELLIHFPFRSIIPLALAVLTAGAQPSVIEDSLSSTALHRVIHFRVCLPPAGEGRYPAILLLHGFTGDYRNWTDIASVERYAARDSIIIVTTDGDDSWYVNSLTDTASRFEDCFVGDILPHLLRTYPADEGRVGIAGASMGGFGALVLGLRHPQRFRFIGAMSASLDIPFGIPDLERNGRGGFRPSLERAFGRDTSQWGAVTPQSLVRTVDSASMPYLYLVNGIQDEFTLRLTLYRSFVDILRARGLRYEYHETPGRHSWSYWEREIAPLLMRFRELCR